MAPRPFVLGQVYGSWQELKELASIDDFRKLVRLFEEFGVLDDIVGFGRNCTFINRLSSSWPEIFSRPTWLHLHTGAFQQTP